MMGALQVLGIAFALLVCSVRCLRFDLAPATTKCLSEEIQPEVLVLGNYHVVQENHRPDEIPKIFAQVTSPYGNTLHYAESVSEGHFGFTTKESGTYMTCIWATKASSNHEIGVEFELKTGVSARDWSNIAKKEKLEGMELELRKLEDMVESIHQEMLYLRER
ncbi:hypothetical protein O6H91_Y021300 [Diphasiastrum complanatum]|nr:hypothetical protein O6H91_Y021300 [Diphasiastrum complanatum]